MNKIFDPYRFKLDNLSIRITKETAANFTIQVGFAVLSFVLTTILARHLGVKGFSAYSNAIAWANIFTIFAPFGLGSLLVRDVATLRAQNKWSILKGLIRFSDISVFTLTLLFIIVQVIIALIIFSGTFRDFMFAPLMYSTLLIPLWAFSVLRQSIMQGLEKPLHATLPDMIIRPLFTIIGTIILYSIHSLEFSSTTVIIVNIIASAIALGTAFFWVKKLTPIEIQYVHPEYETKKWIRSATPLFLFSGAQIIISQSPLIFLGVFGNPTDTGMYSVASRLSNIMIYLPLATGFVISPLIARLTTAGETKKLQQVLTKTAWGGFILSLPLMMIFLFLGKNILAIFGQDFIFAYRTLIILAIGYLIDISFGNSINLLIMTGHEHIIAVFSGLNALLNISLYFLVVHNYGFEGAALVSTFTLIFSRCILAIYAYRKTGFHTTIFTSQIKDMASKSGPRT